jgi:hypothetical protein
VVGGWFVVVVVVVVPVANTLHSAPVFFLTIAFVFAEEKLGRRSWEVKTG